MEPKELKNSSLSANVNHDSTKYIRSSPALVNKNKSFNELETNSMAKVDVSTARPCAIIGPDRVLPQTPGNTYMKKTSTEPWPYSENVYRQPPDYPTKTSEYQPTRNISPRQTFQENMKRIMVSVKNSDNSHLKNFNLNMPQEAKYCDVPYIINTNDHKSVKNSDVSLSSVNPSFDRSVPPYGWPSPVNIRPVKPYCTPEFYQHSEHSNFGPRSMTVTRPLRIHHEETSQNPAMYSERLYQETNIRFKPYPIPKEKHQQMRYDYINNYQNTYPPVPIPPHKYDLQKPLHPPYPAYSQLKYIERRAHDPLADGNHQRPNQSNLNTQFRNHGFPPPYGPMSGNCLQNKPYDIACKPMTVNKHLTFDSNNKIYFDLEPTRSKGYPIPENIYYNNMNHIRSDMVLSNHSTLNMHTIPQHQTYRRDNMHVKPYDYNVHFRNGNQPANLNYYLPRVPMQFSPNAIAISPSDSNTSLDTTHTVNTNQEDCGYVSQSSTASVRSLDSGYIPLPNEIYHRTVRNSLNTNEHLSRTQKIKAKSSSSKNLNVRQFLQMWNEGEDETNESTKDVTTDSNHLHVQSEQANNQEPLYVLGLVNVPSEELSKYEHIQKISKLPENIKGYNNIEILNQYEKLVESTNIHNTFNYKPTISKEHHFVSKRFEKENTTFPRPVSPLDVEAKISQSVIHKEVGCNFEIRPCSPEMLNVQIPTPVQNILGERIIEKVTNITVKSPLLARDNENMTQNSSKDISKNENCIIINNQYTLNNYQNLTKSNDFGVQDFDTNTGICLTSLPRLDNDIELNFPEINQQFITDNKMRSEPVASLKDLPRLDLELVNPMNENHRLLTPPDIYRNNEKESFKLSKYRKTKKSEFTLTDENLNSNKEQVASVQQRVNSVIIKNPENLKLHESVIEEFSSNFVQENHKQMQSENEEEAQQCQKTDEGLYNFSFETAIDFSLSKNDEESSNNNMNKLNNLDYSQSNDTLYNERSTENVSKKTGNSQLVNREGEDSKESLAYIYIYFQENDYIRSKRIEENNIPVIKELACELESSTVKHGTNREIHDIHQKNEDNHLNFKREEPHEENLNDNDGKQIAGALNIPDIGENQESKKERQESFDDFELEFKNITEKTASKQTNEHNISNHEENFSSDTVQYTNSSEEVNKDLTDLKTITGINENNPSLDIIRHDKMEPLQQILDVSVKEDESNKEVIGCSSNINVAVSVTTQDDVAKNINLMNNNGDKYILQVQNESCEIRKESNVAKGKSFDEICNKLEDENEDEINKSISESVPNMQICSEIIKIYTETKTESDKEKPNKKSDDECSTCSKQSQSTENQTPIVFLGKDCKSIESSHNINQVTKSEMNMRARIYKELFSPWIQKLYLFNEGFCENVSVGLNFTNDLKKDKLVENIVENFNTCTGVDNYISTLCEENTADKSEIITINTDTFELNGSINNENYDSVNVLQNDCNINIVRRKALKRSLSESALHKLKDHEDLKSIADRKRKKKEDNFINSHIMSEDICNIIQNNRRNSVSTFCNENNLYIVIDNDLIITEENESSKMYFSKISEDCNVLQNETADNNGMTLANECEYSAEKSVEEPWVEDVACIETVVSEDTIEDFEYSVESPKQCFSNETVSDESIQYSDCDHIDKVRGIYGTALYDNIHFLESLYCIPQMDVDKTLNAVESQSPNKHEQLTRLDYDSDTPLTETDVTVPSCNDAEIFDEKEYIGEKIIYGISENDNAISNDNNGYSTHSHEDLEPMESYKHIFSELPNENVIINSKTNSIYSNSSSPEVSSTTSEEKSSSILLKITNHNGSIMSQISNNTAGIINKPNYELTKNKEYMNYNSNFRSSHTLITKAAQKYIPPLKESIRDLKVKLPLPEHRLNTLKKLKISKVEPKIDNIVLQVNDRNLKRAIIKKQKPKFEDVLKSIDEIQLNKHKNKIKKSKNVIPKVVIKKNENGAHYASSNSINNTDTYNPDLTGRKWQPWVFLEKNNFIDKMAIKNKLKAVYCHRKNSYVLAERFKKYKSIYNANFVISQPNTNNSNKGNLKYTIRLKHV